MQRSATVRARNYTPISVPAKGSIKSETITERNMRLFECAHDHTPNAETIAAIEEGESILSGNTPAKRFSSADEFFAYLGI